MAKSSELPPAEAKTGPSGENARLRRASPWPKVEKIESLATVSTPNSGETGVGDGGIAVGGTGVSGEAGVWVDVSGMMVAVDAGDSTAENPPGSEQANSIVNAASTGTRVFTVRYLAVESTRLQPSPTH